ncbi:hypothetical protein ICE98_02667 [Lactococcus lactis]|nr:hypothetical protein [Lactococcus lactis]
MFVQFNRKESLIDLGIMKNRRFVALIFSLLVIISFIIRFIIYFTKFYSSFCGI